MDTAKVMDSVKAANRAMNKAAEDAIAMSEMLLMDKVQHMKRIRELEAALRDLTEAVKAGEAVSGAEAVGAAEAALANR